MFGKPLINSEISKESELMFGPMMVNFRMTLIIEYLKKYDGMYAILFKIHE